MGASMLNTGRGKLPYMSTLQERIAELMTATGLSVGQIAEIAGVTSSAVSQWKDGPTKALKTGPATRLAEKTGFRARWIADGDGPKTSALIASENLATYGGKPIVAIGDDDSIPDGVVLIKESRVRFSGGNGHIVPHYEEIEESAPATYRRAWFTHEGMNPTKVRRFQVKGDSMAPLLFGGDTVLVNMAETDIRDGYVYALRYGDDLRVKRCYRKLDGGLILHSDNPEHRPRDEEIPASAVEHSVGIIGRVREKSGKGGL